MTATLHHIGIDAHADVGICFMPVTENKSVKNRVHLDLNPGADASPADREEEIERTGATVSGGAVGQQVSSDRRRTDRRGRVRRRPRAGNGDEPRRR
jgi:hypothetical protein